eukprot:241366_1
MKRSSQLRRVVFVGILIATIILTFYNRVSNYRNENSSLPFLDNTQNANVDKQNQSKFLTNANKQDPGTVLSPLRRITACQNEVYAAHSISIWTLVINGDGATHMSVSALKLGRTIRRHTTIAADLMLMELDSKPLSRTVKTEFLDAGWKICTVPKVLEHEEGCYKDVYTKMNLWSMTAFQTVVYIDADAMVVGNIDSLLSINLTREDQTFSIAAVRDLFQYPALDTMNTGVIVIHPNEHEFQKHLKTLHSDPKWANETQSPLADNSYLPAVYKNEWYVLPADYNTFAAFFNTPIWDEVKDTVRIIHFPGVNKPWNCTENMRELCDIWIKI